VIASLVVGATVSSGWKWLAVVIGLGALGLLWAVVALTNKTIGWRVWRLVEGADGPRSTSKFQWAIWLVVILFAYVVLWVLRARQGDWTAISAVPQNLLTVLGFSTVTAATAKGITVGYTRAGFVTKAIASQGGPVHGGILEDDTGLPELAKIQMVAFTFLAAGIFLATVIHQVLANPVQTDLPDIDSSLLVLMGISQGGYLGKKLVTRTPTTGNAA